MAESSNLLQALQRIANTSRRFNFTCAPKTTLATPSTPSTNTPTILESLPEHRPLFPLLLSHRIPKNLASVCSERHERYAKRLKSHTEAKLVPYLTGRDTAGDGSHLPKIYSLFVENYSHTLRDWAQSILNTALRSLRRDPIELRDWDATYPPPMWLPSSSRLQSTPTHKDSQKLCPLSSAPPPPHAFPTIYPPPVRPPPTFPPVEWPRALATSSSSPSTSTIDLDSLCLRFSKSLVIDENPAQPLKYRSSIFSLPVSFKEGEKFHCSHRRSPKGRHSKTQNPQEGTTYKSPFPLRTAKSRQLSVPSSLSPPSQKIKPIPRKVSAPARVSMTRGIPKPTSPHHTSPPVPISGGMDALHPGLTSFPLSQSTPLNPTPGQVAPNPRGYTPSDLATPPALLPDLFIDPIIVPSTPVHLSPRSSLIPMNDSFLQLQPQYDYFQSSSLISASGATVGFATDDPFSKNAFNTPLGFDHFFHGTHVPTSEFSENFFNTYIMTQS